MQSDLYALTLLIKISILKGENKKINQYSQLFDRINSDNKNIEHLLFYQKLNKYNIINNRIIDKEIGCLAKIAPFATNLANLEYLDNLMTFYSWHLLQIAVNCGSQLE